MKKTLLIFMLFGQMVFAQQIDVLSIKIVDKTATGGYYHPVFSPTNQYLLATDVSYKGLKQISLTNGEIKIITDDPGAGYGVRISNDGSAIMYRKNELINNLKYGSLMVHSLKTGTKQQLVSRTREQMVTAFSANKPFYVKGTKLNRQSVAVSELIPITQTEDRKLVLYNKGVRKVLAPNGVNESYFWSSVSPDFTKIVYTVAGKGTFVCDMNGLNVKSLGKLSAPKWLNNNWVVGMDDKDNGEFITASSIVAVSANAKVRQALTQNVDMIALYPAASADAKQVAFCTEKGQLYLININIK